MKQNSVNPTRLDKPRRGNRWPLSLDYAARKLGCNTQHLGCVLRDRRPGYGLKEQYYALAEKCAANATAERPSRRRVRVAATTATVAA